MKLDDLKAIGDVLGAELGQIEKRLQKLEGRISTKDLIEVVGKGMGKILAPLDKRQRELEARIYQLELTVKAAVTGTEWNGRSLEGARGGKDDPSAGDTL